MPTYTIAGSSDSDSLHCYGDDFEDVANGIGQFDTARNHSQASRFPGIGNEVDSFLGGMPEADYNVGLWFIPFDTSEIPVGEVVTSVKFSAYENNRMFGPSAWSYEVYAYDFGETIDEDDWLTPSDLSGMTLLASWAASAESGAGQYYDFTSEEAFKSAIVKGGTTRLVVASSFHRTVTEPTDANWYFVAWDGVSNRPFLVIETEEAPPPPSGDPVDPVLSPVRSPVVSPVRRPDVEDR